MSAWRLPDLTLLESIALLPGPRGYEQQFTGEPLLLSDGRSAYIHTFNCGLYLVRGLDGAEPRATFVKGFEGKNCVFRCSPATTGCRRCPRRTRSCRSTFSHPEHPRDVRRRFQAWRRRRAAPWITIDDTGRRIALNSAARPGTGNRIHIIDFDPASGALTLDERFRDAGAARPGVSFTSQKTWPHGFTGKAIPHGTVFSR